MFGATNKQLLHIIMTPRRFLNVRLLLSLINCIFGLFFTGAELHGQAYHFRQYTANDGLPTNSVYGGIQDQKGLIWFYTEHGVSRFDGYQFRNFTVEDGLPANDVWLIAEDEQGRIWVNTYSRKLVAIEGDSVKTYYESTSPDFQSFDFKVNNGKITIYEKGTPNILVPDDDCCGVQQLPVPEEVRNAPGYMVFPYARDTFLRFYKSQAKVSRIANGGFREAYLIGEKEKRRAALNFKHWQSRAYWHGKLFIWSAQDSLLHFFAPLSDRIEHFNLNQVFGRTPNLVRYQKLHDQLQVQTNLGLFLIDADMKGVDTLKFSLPAQGDIHRSFKDREGNYWVCSKDQGVFFLTARQRNAKLFTFDDQYDVGITHLKKSSNGTIIAGTREGAVLKLHADLTLTTLLPKLQGRLNDSRNVNALCFRNQQYFWVARPLLPLEYVKLDGEKVYPQAIDFTSFPIEGKGIAHHFHTADQKITLGQSIKDLAWHAPSQRLCVARGTHPYLLHYAGENTPQRLELLTEKRTYACAFTPAGKIWLGHIDGLAQYTQQGGYQAVTTPNILQGIYVQELVFDPNTRTLWIGTDGRGLIAYQEGNAFVVEGTAGLSINDLHLHEGVLLAATNKGVKQIRIANPLESTYIARSYGIREGLPSVEAHAIVEDNGALYVGSNMGLAKTTKRERFFNFSPPLLYFSGIEVDGAQLAPDTTYVLSVAPYQLSFHFAGLSFKSLGDIHYFYKLSGEDEAQMETRSRHVHYTNLAPGKYTFTVQAEDNNQQRSNTYTAKVIIPSNFWRQSLPWILAVLVLLFAGWILLRWRLHRIRQQTEQDNAINRQFAELELQALQAQMNPHFVFNSLSAIQYFIAANEKQQADNYLSKFALLMRQFLESSKTRYLNLHQELNLIQLYIELEQMRFPGRFEAAVEVAPEVNPYTTLIPAMLLQPFVENAINHGLFHKTEKGYLQLNIVKNPNQALICTLEDNGVGRAAAKGIQQQTGKAYRSRATQITSERLNALRVIEGYDVNIAVIDLKKPDGSAAGTRVVITVPEIE